MAPPSSPALAIVLIFAAIAERFDYQLVRLVLLSLAAVLVAGFVAAFGQPITTG